MYPKILVISRHEVKGDVKVTEVTGVTNVTSAVEQVTRTLADFGLDRMGWVVDHEATAAVAKAQGLL